MNERKAGIFISYINIFLHTLIGFLYVPLLLFYIGSGGYGLYQLIGSFIAYFSIMDFGLTTAIVRFYAKYKALNDRVEMENILAISSCGYAVISLVILCIGGVCYFCLDSIFAASMTIAEIKEAGDLFLLLLFNITVTLFGMIFRAVINAHEKFIFLKGMETVELVIQPVIVVAVLQKYPAAFSVAMVQTLLNLGLILIRGYYCFHRLKIKIHFHYWDKNLIYEFKKLALSVFAISLIDQVFFKTNQVILGIVSGTFAVAVYSISSLIYMNYMALSNAISGVYLPHVTEMVTKKEPVEKLSELFIQIGRWQYFLLALVATGFIIFGQQFIRLWAGNGFEDAYWITLLIIIPFTIDLIQNLGLCILQAQNRYDFRAKVYFCVGVLNLVMAIPLAVNFGGIGCAFATGLSMFIGNGLVMNYYYKQVIGLEIVRFWREIGKVSIVICFAFITGYISNVYFFGNSSVFHFLGGIASYIFIYSVFVYLFALSAEEKIKLERIFRSST